MNKPHSLWFQFKTATATGNLLCKIVVGCHIVQQADRHGMFDHPYRFSTTLEFRTWKVAESMGVPEVSADFGKLCVGVVVAKGYPITNVLAAVG